MEVLEENSHKIIYRKIYIVINNHVNYSLLGSQIRELVHHVYSPDILWNRLFRRTRH